jgi:hypothetical protein
LDQSSSISEHDDLDDETDGSIGNYFSVVNKMPFDENFDYVEFVGLRYNYAQRIVLDNIHKGPAFKVSKIIVDFFSGLKVRVVDELENIKSIKRNEQR